MASLLGWCVSCTGKKNLCRLPLYVRYCKQDYSKSVLGAFGLKSKGVIGAAAAKKILLPVETDPERLVNYVCGSNIYKEGEDLKLKDDSEYPDWLWKLRLGPPPDLDEMDPNTKDYWEAVELKQKIRWYRLKRPKTKKKMFVNETDKIEKLKALRFRALAYQYDPGYEKPPKFDKDMWRIT